MKLDSFSLFVENSRLERNLKASIKSKEFMDGIEFKDERFLVRNLIKDKNGFFNYNLEGVWSVDPIKDPSLQNIPVSDILKFYA